MATIVQHQKSGRKFVLLGVGYGGFKAVRSGMFIGEQTPSKDTGEMELAAVCDPRGNIAWVPAAEVVVIEIDGRPPLELIQPIEQKNT